MRLERVAPVAGPELLAALERALHGGPAVLPSEDPRVADDDVPDDVCLVVPTSGSTGEPKGVLLTTACLTASGLAAQDRLGGPAHWLSALPVTHVGGLQPLLRSLLAGTSLVVAGTSTEGFLAGTADLPPGRRCTSIVPTQLRRLLAAGPAAVTALTSYDAVLVGAAATPPALLEQARAAGARVVTTYGMTETSGGCVYDGSPLDGVRVELDGDRVVLSGPVVARGYRGSAPFGGTFATSDAGRWVDGRLEVLGRLDDVVVTGGEKVSPGAVEDALSAHPSVREVGVVGVPDAEWGARVVAVVVLDGPLTLEQAREHVAARVSRVAAPRELRVVDALPMLASGKIDRVTLREAATTTAQWVEGARPRTLPAALSPVLVGTGAAAAADGFRPLRAVLALVVALALQVGVNYANDYSDGIRGTDADRVGPLRLVGSGVTPPKQVLAAALAAFGVAAVTGLVLAALTTYLLLLVGLAALTAAWGYTGGRNPYGYRGLGEVSVFVFFGLVAVIGTAYVQVEDVLGLAVGGGIASGALACAILVTNNLRDIPTDGPAGKRTLAVRLGDRRTRQLYAGLLVVPFLVAGVLSLQAVGALLALLAVPLAVPPLRTVLRGARGRDLVAVLKATGQLQLAYGVLLAVGLALS